MNNRERVLRSIQFLDSDSLPYSLSLTGQMYEKVKAHQKGEYFFSILNNHIDFCELNLPQTPHPRKSGCYIDEFGVIWNKNGADKDIGVIDNKLIGCPDDLLKFEFPKIDRSGVRARCEKVFFENKNNFRIVNLAFSLFERAWTLCSMEDLLCYMITDPEFVHALMQKITDYCLCKMETVIDYNFDCFMFGDDWGQQRGLIMGPKHWREFILPYLKQLYKKTQNYGKYVGQHSCGDIHELFDDLIFAGLNIYQTFQPEIYDLKKYKQILDKRLSIWGGISTQADLPNKTPDEIKEITKQTIDIMWNNGGYIAAPTHSVPGDVPVENIIAMVEVFNASKH